MAKKRALKASELRKAVSDEMRALLKFIASGETLTTQEGRVAHAWQSVGYASGSAKKLLDLIGEKP